MRKTIVLSSALLLCSPIALADGITNDPRDAELADELNATTYTAVETDADLRATAVADSDRYDNDIDFDANMRMDTGMDRELIADADADIDVDVDTNIDEKFERLANETMEEFRELDNNFDNLADRAFGYAVFDTTKGGLILTGTGGTGVAVNGATGEKTYMRVGGAGLGLGAGLQNFKLVLLFETADDFEEFVNGDWNGNAAAQAVIANAGASATADFEAGVAAYQLNQKGLMAQVDLTALKFWVADSLETRNS
ncbi:MAG: hypothetical protein HKN49_03930 [Gammaproteobacteria bacterium]|nr:hypothetical protein [Gammaproteobacteria bacterium]